MNVNTQSKCLCTGEERCASLRAFDHHYKHMMLVNPRYVKDKFVSQDFFTNGDPYADNASFLPNNTKMEGMLKTIRNSIALNGDFVLMQLIEVFHSVAMYAALGDKLIGMDIMNAWLCIYCSLTVEIFMRY